MRYGFLSFVLASLIAAFLAGPAAGKDETRAVPAVDVRLSVQGMTCPAGCPPAVRRAIEKKEGVEKVSVDFAAKSATVRYRPDRVGLSELVFAYQGTRFQVKPASAPVLEVVADGARFSATTEPVVLTPAGKGTVAVRLAPEEGSKETPGPLEVRIELSKGLSWAEGNDGKGTVTTDTPFEAAFDVAKKGRPGDLLLRITTVRGEEDPASFLLPVLVVRP